MNFIQSSPPTSELIRTASRHNGHLADELRFHARDTLLVIDEIGHLLLPKDGANLLIQLVSARYEKGAMVLTSNHTFSKWAKVFGNSVVASALLDWSRVEHIGHGFVMDVRCPIA